MARAFGMDDATWARHANPWSVWTRNTALPLLVLAIWSRVWLGWWSLVPLSLAMLWTWLNPRLFPVPASTESWASRAVLGERVWLNRGQIPIPAHHSRAPHLLTGIAAMGVPFLAWGLYRLQLWPTLLGSVLIFAGKLWFLDRMVWLYQDMLEPTSSTNAGSTEAPAQAPPPLEGDVGRTHSSGSSACVGTAASAAPRQPYARELRR